MFEAFYFLDVALVNNYKNLSPPMIKTTIFYRQNTEKQAWSSLG